MFDLEWDRGTEHARRVRTKASSYVTYFRGRRHADLHHVLFVAPTRVREGELHDLIGPDLPPNVNLCRFGTTAVETIASIGLLGALWLQVAGSPHRHAFADMPGFPRGLRLASDCIAKPEWWKCNCIEIQVELGGQVRDIPQDVTQLLGDSVREQSMRISVANSLPELVDNSATPRSRSSATSSPSRPAP